MGVKDDVFGRGLNSNPNPNNQGTRHVNDLVERLELLILETKAGHEGLYDGMLDISKQRKRERIIQLCKDETWSADIYSLYIYRASLY